jgi:hypothetical protein
MSRKCAKCGLTFELDQTYQIPSATLFYCPSCQENKSIQLCDSFFKAGITAMVTGFIWVIFSPQNDFAWFFFQSGLMLCFINLLTLPHELGHTITAFLTGANIFQVSVGMGKILFKCDFLGTEWILHKIPFSGYTLMGFDNNKFYRLRNFLVYLGGPLVNFLLIFLPVPLLFILTSPWLLALSKSFIMANIYVFLHSLYPRKFFSSGMYSQSDGLSLLTIPFMSDEEINQQIETSLAWQKHFDIQKDYQ